MNDVERFLAHAMQLEREAARRYEELGEGMRDAALGALLAEWRVRQRRSQATRPRSRHHRTGA